MARVARRIFLALASILLVAAFAAFGLHAWPQWSRARSSASWPSVEGTVVRCDVVAARSSGHRAGGPTYGLDLLVSYEINGITLVTDRDGFDSVRTSDGSWYRARARELAAGTRVPVRYDPADPGFAVLRAEGGWIPFVLPGGLLVMAIVFGLLARFAKPPPLLELIEITPGLRRLGAALLGCLSLAFLTLGTFGMVVGLGRVGTLGEASAWPERQATIVRSEWRFESNGAIAGARPTLAYRYEIDGIEHESGSVARVAIVDPSIVAWNRRILEWRPGDRVPVRVDPSDPTRAALEVPSRTGELIPLAVAVGFIVIGLAGASGSIRLVRSARSAGRT